MIINKIWAARAIIELGAREFLRTHGRYIEYSDKRNG